MGVPHRLAGGVPGLEEAAALHGAVEDVAIDDVTADPWQRERLMASLDRLSPASRAVITLHYLEEMPLSEVAAVLDLSIGTVKSRLAYGLSQLRKADLQ